MFFINHTDIGDGSSAIIEIEGPLNSESTPDFDEYISKLVDNKVIYLLLDMKNLQFISSEGIGACLMIQKSINGRNGIAVFFNLNYEITSLFKLLGFDKVFTLAENRADALNILDRHMELFPSDNKSDEVVFDDELYNEDKNAFAETGEPEPELFDIIDDKKNEGENIEPFIIECLKCKSLIRIKEYGDQLCPYCSAGFTVSDKQKAVFKIK